MDSKRRRGLGPAFDLLLNGKRQGTQGNRCTDAEMFVRGEIEGTHECAALADLVSPADRWVSYM